MAIIYSYPTVDPVREDLVLGTDVSSSNKATKNFTIQSIIDLVTVATGDLQTVLNLGNVATGFDIDLTNSSFIGGGFRTVGGIIISGTIGTGFTNITSTLLTGTVATAAQPNITSLGSLTALVIDGPISGTNLITSSNLAGAQNDNVVSTLAIKTYVDNQVGLYDTLAEVLASGNITGGTDIAVSANDDITFTDTSKVILGTGADATIEHDGTDLKIINTEGKTTISNSSGDIDISATAATKKTTINGKAGVDLQFDGSKKLETLTGGAKVTGAFEATAAGTFVNLLNSGTYQDSSGDVGTAGQILSSTATGTNWVTEVPLYNWSLEGTAIPSGAAVTVTDGTNITTTWDAANYDLSIAVTGLPDGTGAANQVTFWSDTDTLTGAAGFTFAGGATGKVAIAGELEIGGVLTDGTFTGSGGTYTGYTSITSTDFVGALTGNADTATALASSGAIAITGDTTSTGGPYTYTSGGSISIATTIADTTVTGKVLTNLATPTSSAIAATDTILAAMAKLQGQITGLAGSLAFEGTWDASAGTAPSATPLNGQFWIVSVAGSTNLSGITDWLVGDWAIYVNNGAGTDAWQKLDQSNEVLGSGTAQKMAMWSGTVGDASQTLATGLIEQDSANTLITIGNSGSLLVEGNTTLGNAVTDTVTAAGPVTFNETLNIKKGIFVDGTQGTDGYVLTSGNGSGAAMSWAEPTVGTVTSVSATTTGDALDVAVSTATTTPAIALTWAGGAAGATDYVNGLGNLTTFPTLDNYASWTADSDEGTDITVTSGFNLKFTGAVTAGGAGIATDSAVSANEMTIGLINAGGTPGATTFYRGDGQWSVPVGTKTETLAEVLVNGNTTGGTDIAVADNITFADNSKALFGAGSDLQIYHTGSQSYIKDAGTGSLIIESSDLFLRTNSTENAIVCAANASVTLYHDNVAKLATTSTGVTVLGQGLLMEGTSSPQEAVLTMGTLNNTPTIKMMKVGSNYIYSPNGSVVLRSGGTPVDGLSVSSGSVFLSQYGQGNKLGTPTYDLAVNSSGKILEVEQTFPYQKSGIFNGYSQIAASTNASTLFTVTRESAGQLIFDVWITTFIGSMSRYVVAHQLDSTPVYNKLLEAPGGDSSTSGITISFDNATSSGGTTGNSVECKITTDANWNTTNVNWTVQVGYMFSGTLSVS